DEVSKGDIVTGQLHNAVGTVDDEDIEVSVVATDSYTRSVVDTFVCEDEGANMALVKIEYDTRTTSMPGEDRSNLAGLHDEVHADARSGCITSVDDDLIVH